MVHGTWRYQRGTGQGQAGRVAHEACIYTVFLGQGAHGHWQGMDTGRAGQGTAWQGTTRHDKARQGKARQGKARQGKARQVKARQGKARQSKARIAHKRTAELDCTSTYSSNSCRATPAAKVAARHAVTATGREKERGEVS
jgi:hypothetical protein